MKKTISILLAVMMAAALLSSCGKGGTSPSSATNTFKIGGTGPLTGDNAVYGTAAKNGATIAVNEINAKGGMQFDLNYQDDVSSAEKAVNAYNALKDWGMQISLGSVTSTPSNATNPLANKDGIFTITPAASSAAILVDANGNPYGNTFQMCFQDPAQGTGSAQMISGKQLGTKIAVIYKNDDVYSSGINETFQAEAKAVGLNIVSTTTFTDSSSTDFSVQLKDAQSKGADLIFLPIYYTPASLIFKQAADMGYAPKFFGVDGMDGILTLEGFDTSLAEGVMLLTPFSADAKDTLTQNFVKSYQAAYGEIPNQFAADGYDCIYAIYNAIMQSNGAITANMSAKDIGTALIGIFNGGFKFDGVTGTGMTWASSGEVSKGPHAVVIQNGVYVGIG